jgi:hypothetical protein
MWPGVALRRGRWLPGWLPGNVSGANVRMLGTHMTRKVGLGLKRDSHPWVGASSPVSRGSPRCCRSSKASAAAPSARRPRTSAVRFRVRARELHPRRRRTERRERPPPPTRDGSDGVPRRRRGTVGAARPPSTRSCIRWRPSCANTTTASNSSPASTSSWPASKPSDRRSFTVRPRQITLTGHRHSPLTVTEVRRSGQSP